MMFILFSFAVMRSHILCHKDEFAVFSGVLYTQEAQKYMKKRFYII